VPRVVDDEAVGPPPIEPRSSSTVRSAAIYVAASLTALFMLRLLGASWDTHFPAVWPDAVFPKQGYLAVAAKGPFRPSFYFAFRPIGYPLLLWFFGRSSHLTVIAQTAIYSAAVIALYATALRVMRTRTVGVITSVLIVGMAVQAKYAMWNTQILSESLAISLGFAAIAAWWRFAAEPTVARALWGYAFVVAWLVVRDAHVLPATVVIVPVSLAVARFGLNLTSEVRRALVAGAIVVVVTAGYSYSAAAASHRAELSFHNVVGVRVLPDSELTRWFSQHGMPLDRALRTRTGKSGLDDDFYLSQDPAFAKYRHWARHGGPRALVMSLILLAPHYDHLLYDDLPLILKGDVSFYDTQSVYTRLPHQMPLQLGGPSTRKGLTIWLVLGVVALAASLVIARRRGWGASLTVFGATGLFLSLLEIYTTWGGDPVEMQRHLIGALSRLSLMLIIVVASAVDAAIVEGSRSEVPATPRVTSAGRDTADA
jgi:hypothetical protein